MKRAFLASVAASCFLVLAGFGASAQTYPDANPAITEPAPPPRPSATPAPPTNASPSVNDPMMTPDTMNPDGTAPDPMAPDTAAPSPQAQAPVPPDQPQMAQACAASSGEVFFETNSDAVDTQSQEALIQSAASLRTCSSAEIVVAGHADARGSDEYNMALSERRAESVRDLLVAQGVQARLIRVEAKGEAEATGDMTRDRRVEVEVRTVNAALPEADTAL